MANGKLAGVAELQIGDALIPVFALQAPEIGTRYEGSFTLHLELSLKGKGFVAPLIRGRLAAVDQEYRDGAGSFRQAAVRAVAGDRAHREGELKAVARGHVGFARPGCGLGDSQRHVFGPLRAFPFLAGAMTVGELAPLVVGPADANA